MKGGIDLEGVLSDYHYALRNYSLRAVENVVAALRSGDIEEASKEFSPKAPKLAEYVRAEQRRLDILNAPKAISGPAIVQKLKHADLKREETIELSRQGYRLLAEEIGHLEFQEKVKRKAFPAGAIWFAALGEVWSRNK